MRRATLIYDGECPFCRRAAVWAMKHARNDALETLPCQHEDRERRFPEISREQCLAAMRLVTPEGRVYSGEQALPPLMDLMTGWRWMARILRLPGIRHASPAAYRWFANHRYALAALAGQRRDTPCGNNGDKPRDERKTCE